MSHCLADANCPDTLRQFMGGSTIALCLADPDLPDEMLIAVNDRFCSVTGYAPQEALGRNCRFLQPATGAGPVRDRMRAFMADPQSSASRFVIPNVRRSGEPFLNVVYLANLRHPSGRRLVLGSQFAVEQRQGRITMYEKALREDMHSLAGLMSGEGWVMAGSLDSIANTTSLLAQYRLATKEIRHG